MSKAHHRSFLIIFLLFFLTSFSFADQLIIEPDAGRAPLLTAIRNAKHSIDVAMYGFTDEAFVNALIEAKKDNKNVRVLLEPQPYKAENENNNAIQALRTQHVNLQWPDSSFKLIHQKTFILDQQTALVMTFNLTHSSFKRERNFALVLTEPGEVKEISQVFAADYMHQNAAVTQPNLLWSPNNSREKILQLIRSANSEIKIYAQDVSDFQTIGALAKAARAGVDVKILLSATPEKMHSKKFLYLKKAGVIIHNSRRYYIHAKVILVDHQRALLGSINLTKYSLDKNRELSVITQDTGVINQLNSTFNEDWGVTETTRRSKNQSWPTKQFLRQANRFYHHIMRSL